MQIENIELPLDVRTLQRLLPHRYPFLLLDRVIGFEKEKSLTAIKNISVNEPFFQGHFPDFPVMPGVLIIEAMAQAAGVLAILSRGERKENEIYFFVVPGDQVQIHLDVITHKRDIGKFKATATVDGQIAAEAVIMCAKRAVDK